mgnify:CR=1 FL=1
MPIYPNDANYYAVLIYNLHHVLMTLTERLMTTTSFSSTSMLIIIITTVFINTQKNLAMVKKKLLPA